MGPSYIPQYPISLETVIQQRLPQLEVAKQLQTGTSVLDEIQKITSSLTEEEKTAVLNSEEYKSAQAVYETGFMSFLNNRFYMEYLNTPEGRIAGENLLKTISEKKSSVQVEIQKRNARLEKLAKFLEDNPELAKKMEETK